MRIPEDSLLSKALTAILPAFIALVQRAFSITIRRRYLNRQALDAVRAEGKPYIMAVWHCCVLWTPFFHKNHGIQAMVSPSRDGEIIARVVEWSGNYCIRGSSNQGGSRALIGLVRLAKKGHPSGIVPDGPLGPAFECKGGIITIAQRTGLPIIPFHYEASKQWVAKSAWDKHRIPGPFSTLYMSYGEPFYVPSRLSDEQFDALRRELGKKMMENMHRCQEAAGYAPGSDT
ncbi:MAG: lysophospholipid acyltransferase family protein [Leptospiraceae bacterium]|nr:lysophospholipid acyltransferase family protein [Leptospiraceae bacterium]